MEAQPTQDLILTVGRVLKILRYGRVSGRFVSKAPSGFRDAMDADDIRHLIARPIQSICTRPHP